MSSIESNSRSISAAVGLTSISHIVTSEICLFIGDFESIHCVINADKSILPLMKEFDALLYKRGAIVEFSGPRSDVIITGNPYVSDILAITPIVRIASQDFRYVCLSI
jgi:hypothetical protein